LQVPDVPHCELAVQAPAVHLPAVAPVPLPHEPLSHVALLWQLCALVEQVPVAEPVPAPQEPLSQSAFW
jgi:hypothetical protein